MVALFEWPSTGLPAAWPQAERLSAVENNAEWRFLKSVLLTERFPSLSITDSDIILGWLRQALSPIWYT